MDDLVPVHLPTKKLVFLKIEKRVLRAPAVKPGRVTQA